jgi:hypothetical protein
MAQVGEKHVNSAERRIFTIDWRQRHCSTMGALTSHAPANLISVRKMRTALILIAAMAAAAQGPEVPMCSGRRGRDLRLNEIQMIGSHNSYHAGLTAGMAAWLRVHNPRAAETLDYSHPPLDVQLSNGVRQLEIDVFADTHGGRYASPAAPKLIAQAGLNPDPPFDPDGLFKRPGFKVLHVQDIDYRSNCEPFTGCLAIIRTWSDAHPGHLPIYVLIETKEGRERDFQVTPEPFTPAVFDALDREIAQK